MSSETIRAWIDIRRMREMSTQGWRMVGPTDETCVLMEGPDPETTGGLTHISSALTNVLAEVG